MLRLVLLVCFVAATAAFLVPGCQYGIRYLDDCNNACNCVDGNYVCSSETCGPWRTPRPPKSCTGAKGLPERPGQRVFCLNNVVGFQPINERCVPGSEFTDKDGCNVCTCGISGEPGCSRKLCPGPGGGGDRGCPYGKAYIDECGNDCECVDNQSYGCSRKACTSGKRSQVPQVCNGAKDLPERFGRLVACDEGIIKLFNNEKECPFGAVRKARDGCNTCICGGGCTITACFNK